MSPTVVLHRPQDLINIAVIIRAMKNFGVRELRLVAPEEFDSRRIEGIAHKTGDIVERAQRYDTLDEALAELTFVVGLTARGRTAKRNVQYIEDAVAEIHELPADHRVGLLFGPEDKGLTNDDLDRCHRVVTVPTNPDHSSINLAQAVTITLYEWFRTGGTRAPFKKPRRDAPPASREELERFFADTEAALDAIEFFKSRNEPAILRTVRELAHRASLDAREVRLLRAMMLEVGHFLDRKGLRS